MWPEPTVIHGAGVVGVGIRVWTWMYVGGLVSVMASLGVIWSIVQSGNPETEWMFWIFFGLAISLFGGGFYVERDHRRRSADAEAEDPLSFDV
ncbi:MAG: hypothetical protein JSV27_08635 [Candidatus Bathyarchaeota archaeon]|nr:MAG: hypothetical protein JSV27_08635 [Candidatus Bathyarchaeota archaeon]